MNNIQRISNPDINNFYNDFVSQNKPVIITNVVNQWNAYGMWTLDSFSKKYGNINAGVMRLKNGQSDADTYSDSSNTTVPVQQIMSSVQKGIDRAEMVLASTTDVFQPELKNDIETPAYCRNGKFFRSRIYIGPKKLVTTLHQDLPENLYAVIKGGKHITLYAPSDRKFLYPNSLFSKHPNFARFNPDFSDFEKFPLAKNANPIEVFLNEGEMLYIPSLWWHHIRNTEESIAINFWWSAGWKTVIAWTAATYKKFFQRN